MNNIKKYRAVAKVNSKRSVWVAYMVAGLCVASSIYDTIADRTMGHVEDSSIAAYSMLYILCLMAPIFIASRNYVRMMNIGVKKKTYFYGCIINYIVIAAGVSLIGVLEQYLIDDRLVASGSTIYGLIKVFGWDSNVFTAFFSQFAFLILVESVIHTLTFMQTRWYGWLADVAIIAIISVFTPIPVLRRAEVFFFDMIIFTTPIVQIVVCLVLAAVVYATNLFYLKKRTV